MARGWCARNPIHRTSDWRPCARSSTSAGATTIDWFTDAVHGYAPPGTERYNKAASELHWERVHALLRRNVDQ